MGENRNTTINKMNLLEQLDRHLDWIIVNCIQPFFLNNTDYV